LGSLAYKYASNCAPLVTKELGADSFQQPCFTAICSSRGFEIRRSCDNGLRFDPLMSATPLLREKRVPQLRMLSGSSPRRSTRSLSHWSSLSKGPLLPPLYKGPRPMYAKGRAICLPTPSTNSLQQR
ncbi:unnamed protein product, partial [Ectocarpus sp. 12 AP-2014]